MTVATIFPVLLIAALLTFFIYYWKSMAPREGSLEWITMSERSPLQFGTKRHRMTRKDTVPLLAVTVVYAATAFFRLGSLSAPQTFARFDAKPVVLELTGQVELGRMMYYGGLNTGRYTLAVSLNGSDWETSGTLEQGNSEVFKWNEFDFDGTPVTARYVRITPHPSASWMEWGELALYDREGSLLPESAVVLNEDIRLLFDEQDTVPAESVSWYGASYFDEIYHVRTAYEHLRGLYPYEITHPPLGKLMISVGLFLFGLNPFGWRFMGTLFGVLMLPLLYVLIKNLFGKTQIALLGTALFAFNFMHLTQTRIATLDTFVVFFILAAYFFFYRYLTAGRFRDGIVSLFLSGLSFGIGTAIKWPMLYAGAGLAVLWLLHLIVRGRQWESGPDKPRFSLFVVKTVLCSIVFFLVIPGGIYLASYLPNVLARGRVTFAGLWNAVAENQTFMFTFHSGELGTHPYQSSWYQWIVDARPILYFRDDGVALREAGVGRLFSAFDNPVLSWGGLLCVVITAIQGVRFRSEKALFIVIGYLAQLLPWCFITRPTFAYHYFPATLFLALAMCYVLNDLIERRPDGWRIPVYGLPALSACVYVMFYPVLIGLDTPVWYNIHILQWLPSWPLVPPL